MQNPEIMVYLKNITRKLLALMDKFERLETQIQKLGTSCGVAFQQTKEVINHLCKAENQILENLDSYGGIIEGSTFFSGINDH